MQMQLLTTTPPPVAATTPMIAAFCPDCGGWTMFHGNAASETAKEWVRIAYVVGDLVMKIRSGVSLGPACPNGLLDVPLPRGERTCGK